MNREAETFEPHSTEPVVSVVVAARNASRELRTLLGALSQQTLPPSQFEVIVVDDGSDDGTREVAEASDIARVIRSEVRLGLPRARNVGIRASKGELIALTDADTLPDPTWLEFGVARMRANDADLLGGGVSIALGARPSTAALVDAMNWLDAERCVTGGFALGANIWTRRATFERWGVFNEHTPAYGHDDAEWGRRATRGGAKLIYAGEVHLTHPPRSRLRQVWKKAYCLGFALAPHRRAPLNTVEDLPPLFLRPTPFLPPKRIPLERLRERGQEPTPSQVIRIYLAQWLFVNLAMLTGDLMGELAYARERRRKVPTTKAADPIP